MNDGLRVTQFRALGLTKAHHLDDGLHVTQFRALGLTNLRPRYFQAAIWGEQVAGLAKAHPNLTKTCTYPCTSCVCVADDPS